METFVTKKVSIVLRTNGIKKQDKGKSGRIVPALWRKICNYGRNRITIRRFKENDIPVV